MLELWLARFVAFAKEDWVVVGVAVLVALLLAACLAFAVATVFLRMRNNRNSRRWARLERLWEPILLETIVGTLPPAVLRSKVERSDELFFLTFILRYARRLKGPEREMVTALAQPFLARVARSVGRSGPESRARVVQILGALGMPEYADVVAHALDDRSPLVAMIAARSLFSGQFPSHFSKVIARLERFSLWSRPFVASMLASGGRAGAVLLRELLADPTQPGPVRAVAADALRELHDIEAVDMAAAIASEETDFELLAACLRIIARVGNPGQIPVILGLVDAPNIGVRGAALGALTAVGGPSEVPVFMRALDDPSPWVALKAARGLAALGARTALEQFAASEEPRAALIRQVLQE